MKVLHTIRSLDPATGGLVEVVKNFAVALKGLGHSAEIATLDKEGVPWLSHIPARVYALGPSRLTYGYSSRYVPWLKDHYPDYDAVIVNGIWNYCSFGVWRAMHKASIPYYVYVHGMLDPWFKKAHPLKHLKKWLYWPWTDYRVLCDARAVIFTCEEERRLARESFWLYRCNEAVVHQGTAGPSGDSLAQKERFLSHFPELKDKRLFLFLGRIHRKKGCDLLIRAFSHVAGMNPRLQLVIAGPDQVGWQPELQRLSRELKISERVSWTGLLLGDLKWGAFHAADVFVLPSHQENIGIAVVEALACGRPVLISNKINIWREIETDGAGFIGNDDLGGTADILKKWIYLPESQREVMRQKAEQCFATRFEIYNTTQGLIDFLRESGVKD